MLHGMCVQMVEGGEMRWILMCQYGGAEKWQQKVRAMSEAQVQAVYLRLKQSNKLRVPNSVHTPQQN